MWFLRLMGFAGVVYETVVVQLDRLGHLAVFAAMMGIADRVEAIMRGGGKNGRGKGGE